MEDCFTIEKAIHVTSGNRMYQKRILFILVLGEVALASFIMSSPYFLPTFPSSCLSFDDCNVDQRFDNSATYELGSIQESKYEISAFGTSYFVGVLVGSLLIPRLADKYGRRKLVKYTCILGTICYLTAGFSVNMIMLWISGFAVGLLEFGFYMISYVLFTEMLDYQYRNWYLGIYKLMWPISALVYSIFFMLDLYWRYLIILSGCFLVLELLLLRYVFESPRFLLTNASDVQAATFIMNKISVINRVGELKYTLISENTTENASSSLRLICGSKEIIIKLVVCSSVWFSNILVYYSMIFIIPKFISNMYFRNMTMFAADCVGILPASYFSNAIGRRKATVICSFVMSAAFFAISFLPFIGQDSFTLEIEIIVLSMIARVVLNAEFYLLYLYTAELFPTYIRSTAVGICNFFGRFGGIVASSLLIISDAIGIDSSLILGVMMLLTALLSLLLEETNAKPMREMIGKEKDIQNDLL